MALKSTVVQSVADTTAGTNYRVQLSWTQAGGAGVYTLNNGLANIVWSHAMPTFDADQLVVMASDTWTGDTNSRSILVAWKYDAATGTQRPTGSVDDFSANGNWHYETTSTPGVPGAQFTDYSNTISRWNISPTSNPSVLIQLPVQGFWMSLGVYSNGAVGALSATQIFVERLRLSGANPGV